MRKRAWVKIRTTMARPKRSEYRHRQMDNIHTYMIRTCMHAYMYTYMHTHTHTRTHTHTHTHIGLLEAAVNNVEWRALEC